MKQKAYAKINLILDVNKKLANGYHDISFLMTTINLYDKVKIKKSLEDKIIVINNKQLSNEDNLAYKALKLLKEEYNIKNNYKIIIKKNIPISAGMAGGSTDCAAVINIINKLENLQMTEEQKVKIGIKLGADVPFCIFSKLSIANGIGEDLKFVHQKIPSSYVLVVNPLIQLSTKDVYSNYKEHQNKKRKSIEQILEIKNYNDFYSELRNDLEASAKELLPIITNIEENIKKLNNNTKVLMSGSGPTVLCFLQNKKDLVKIKKQLQKKYGFVKTYKLRNNN